MSMRRGRVRILACVVACATLGAAWPRAQQGYDLYGQALAKERAAGDLNAAIALYERIAKEYAADRTLVAKALMRMAACYEQLGSPEAGKTYERIVSQFARFPDQADIVGEARRRLKPAPAAAAAVPPGLVKKPGESPGRIVQVTPGAVSPDGRAVAFFSNDALEIREIGTGRTRSKTAGATGEHACGQAAWAGDSTVLAYTWCNASDMMELRALDIASGAVRTIVPASASQPVPLDWSPDRRSLLVLFDSRPAPDSSQLAVVALSDGRVRSLKTAASEGSRWPRAGATRFSRDGRFVVFTPDDDLRGMMVMSVENGVERPLLPVSHHDLFLGFTPAGNILFVSDRRGTYDVWLVGFEEGQARGVPGPLVSDVGQITPMGFTDAGALYYRTPEQRPESVTDLFMASVNPRTGLVSGSAVPASRQAAGHMSYPVWSPSGRELAYKVGPAGTTGEIFIRTMETDREQRVELPLGVVGQFDWSPDGRSLVVACVRDNAPQIVRVDLMDGALSVILSLPPRDASAALAPGQGELSQPRWLPDGRSVLFVSTTKVERRVLATGDQQTVVTASQPIQSLAVSPDGATVAFVAGNTVMAAALAAGQPRRLIDLSPPSTSAKRVAWSPDGRYVIYVDRTAGSMVPGTTVPYAELWRIPAGGGTPERMGVTAETILQPAMSPDGHHLAFSVNADTRPGVHVLDGFLPPGELVRR